MENTLIKVDCVDQRLLISTAPVLASGGINEDVVEFHFCPLWDGFVKTAIFYRDESSVYYAVVGPDDRCTIPAEVLQSDGDMFFGVFGTSGSVTRTSEILRYKIKLGAITENLKPSEPTPDIYIQLLAALSAMDNKVDKIDGKGLSTNDYSDADKEKLAGVAEGATNVVVDFTLKNSGQAADAKTTGDRLGAVEAFTINPQEYELTGNPVQLDNFEGMPLNVITTLEPIQSGSGDPSPDNIRPISGRTGAKLTRCGKNLMDLSQGYGHDVLKPLNVPAGMSITFSLFPTNGTSQLNERIIYEDGTEDNFAIIGKNVDNNIWYTKTTTPKKQIKEYSLYNTDSSNKRTISKGMIEYGSTATAYEPYQGNDYSADFGQAVYGGTLDWQTGVLTVDSGLMSFDGTENWAYHTNGFFYMGFDVYARSDKDELISSHYPQQNFTTGVKGVAITSTGTYYNQVRFYGTGYSDIGNWKSYLAAQAAAGTPVQIAYKLATPTTIQLTPQEILALDGMNTLYGDGTLNVSGRKDILWLTSRLIERIKTLESAVISLGGNV